MTSRFAIDLARPGPHVAWGFRLQGGSEFGAALSIQRVFSGTPSDGNLQRGDIVSKVNGNDVTNMTLVCAQELIKSAGNRLSLYIQRDSLPLQDLHISSQAPSFVPSDHYSAPGPRQPPIQPTQHFYSNAHPAQSSMTSHPSSGPNVSNVNFHPKPDHGPHPGSQHHYQYQPSHESAPNVDWQSSPAQPTSSTQQQQQQHQQQQQQHHHHPSPPYHHQQEQDVPQQEHQQEQQEHSGDVDDEHLKPVKEIKSMFNHGGSHDGANIVRKGHPVRMAQSKKPQGSTKYQPPSPALKPAATTHVQSAKHPPVYQQRSSYNPLDFQGVNPKSPIPPNRPPGLIQRGAVDIKPKGTGLDYQQPNHFRNDHHPQDVPQQQPPHHQPTITPQGNLDPLTDFYLHGLNAKCDLPDFSKTLNASYSGKMLPPRSEVALKTPTSAPKKKEFKADQSAVYRILQEEEEASKQRGRGGPAPGRDAAKVTNEAGGRAYQAPGSGGRLAELLEKDQAELAPYHEGHQQEQLYQQQQAQQHQQHYQIHHHPQQPQQQQQQQYHQQQRQHHQQQQPQHYQQQSAYQQHSPTKHLMTSTAQFLPSPSREHAPRHHHDYQSYQQPLHQQQPQQQHHNWNQEVGRRNVGHAGLPQTDF